MAHTFEYTIELTNPLTQAEKTAILAKFQVKFPTLTLQLKENKKACTFYFKGAVYDETFANAVFEVGRSLGQILRLRGKKFE